MYLVTLAVAVFFFFFFFLLSSAAAAEEEEEVNGYGIGAKALITTSLWGQFLGT
jgi:hypothetical protein